VHEWKDSQVEHFAIRGFFFCTTTRNSDMAKLKIYQAEEVPITFKSQGAQLVGMHHKVDSDKIIILCHGFTGNKSESKRLFVEVARDCASRGFNAMRFDFYGSGDSEGDFKDFLVSRNIANLSDAIGWAQNLGYEKIAVLGLSLGAATAILTINHVPVDALITWSAVPAMNPLYDYLVDDLFDKNNENEPFEYDGWQLSRDFFEDANQYDIQAELAKITVPKCIMQGTADAQLFVDGFADFQKIVTPPADFMEFPDAGHTFQTPAFRRQVIKQTTLWLLRHL
jgi:pimeloyl-ACP methyl ester carboxylesterase